MVKENKEFFLYILGILASFVAMLILLDFILPGGIVDSECGFLNVRCLLNTSQFITEEKEYDAPPVMKIDTEKDYTAVIKTNVGDIEIDLYEKNASETVNNFVFLAEDDYYDNVKFHRVIKGILVQTGDRNTLDSDPENDGTGGPGYTFADEINWDSLDFSEAKRQQLSSLGYASTEGIVSEHLQRKSVAMANSGPNSNGSQFFIVTGASTEQSVKNLDGRHTVFGTVTSGWEVITTVENVDVDDPTSSSPRPLEDIIITDIVINVS